MPFYKKMHNKTALITAISVLIGALLGLSGCSTPSKTSQAPTDLVLEPSPVLSAQERQTQALERRILQTRDRGQWADFVVLSEQLWQQADAENRAAIEFIVWESLSNEFDTPKKIANLMRSSTPQLQSWGALLHAQQQPGAFALQAMDDVALFEEQAIFSQHLIPALKQRIREHQSLRQLAVLLPLQGKYQPIAEQIRNGLLKAYMAFNPSLSLRFYDTSQSDNAVNAYRQAIQDGADRVIGPLTKESIDQLIQANITDFIALNQTDHPNVMAFNFLPQSESWQIARQLSHSRYQRIGILSSDENRNLNTANQLRAHWLEAPKRQALLQQFPSKNPNLRDALGGLINEETSRARYNNLRWLLGQQMEFFPRTRQDLQAIVLIGSAQQVAVFHPQFEFFQLKLPVYATSNLTPPHLKQPPRNPDLGEVIFPTLPAVFAPHALNTPLEAFGWDSFLVASKGHLLAPGLCLTEGMTGHLFIDSLNNVDKKMIWAQYSPSGELHPWVPPLPTPANTLSIPASDTPESNPSLPPRIILQ
jgi:hypothetical protein